jgi:putative redox protein
MAERLEVRATFRGGWATDVEARGHEVRIDEPASANGDDSGMMPTEVFLASLAACFCMAVAFAGRKRDLAVPGLQVVVTAQRAGNELRYGRIVRDACVVANTRAAPHPATLARLVERARPFCWVSNTLAEGADVEYSHTSLNAHFRK